MYRNIMMKEMELRMLQEDIRHMQQMLEKSYELPQEQGQYYRGLQDGRIKALRIDLHRVGHQVAAMKCHEGVDQQKNPLQENCKGFQV